MGNRLPTCQPVSVVANHSLRVGELATISPFDALVARLSAGRIMPDTPEIRLGRLLDAWTTMDESQWAQEAVDRLKNDILDVFRDYPDEANGWYRVWRALHSERRLG